MDNFKYFTECEGETVQLLNVYHDGHISSKAHHFTGTCPKCGQKHTANRKIEYKNRPSLHQCDARCEGATGHKCECACGGKNHGRAA